VKGTTKFRALPREQARTERHHNNGVHPTRNNIRFDTKNRKCEAVNNIRRTKLDAIDNSSRQSHTRANTDQAKITRSRHRQPTTVPEQLNIRPSARRRGKRRLIQDSPDPVSLTRSNRKNINNRPRRINRRLSNDQTYQQDAH